MTAMYTGVHSSNFGNRVELAFCYGYFRCRQTDVQSRKECNRIRKPIVNAKGADAIAVTALNQLRANRLPGCEGGRR